MTRGGAYPLEDPREKQRLADKVDPVAWVARYLRPHLPGARAVLDVGCGPGVIAGAVADASPGARVTGVDAGEDRVREARRQARGRPNLRALRADATALPFEDDSFDLVYSRFLLEYLGERRRAVEEMARVCRPGGRVLLQDLDGQLLWHYPEDAEMQGEICAVLEALAGGGFDPFVGRKLYHLAHRAGLADLQVAAESYHLYAGRIDPHAFSLWELKLDIALPAIARAIGREAAEGLKSAFLAYLLREDTLTYSVVFTVTGVVPESCDSPIRAVDE